MNNYTLFTQYVHDLTTTAQHGDAREESFYPALAKLLQNMAVATARTQVHVTTLPKATEAGNPDFRLWNGKDRIIGYIEAKKPTEERLDIIERSEQMQRYLDAFPNLILTNFCEFRLYRNGILIQTVLAARPLVLNQLRTVPPVEKPAELYALLDQFLGFSLPKVFNAESLAIELARRTRFLRTVIAQQLIEEMSAPGTLTGFFEAFQTYLIGTITPDNFADLFAQTITYGLFAARTRAKGEFNRRVAFEHIPHTIGVLRGLFRFISLDDLPDPMAWCVDDIAEVLAIADATDILDQYYREGKGSDPIVHFYETFLAQYDPGERERRGVYYTPEPVVDYIVRSLHEVLKNDFGLDDGFASRDVTLLDPAAGTMTFVARAAQQAVTEFENQYGRGGLENFICQHILKNFYAFELMMAPYAVGHLKMGFFLEEFGHRLTDNERMPFYLTNALDHEVLGQSRLPGFSSLADESRLANIVKKQTSILVILGNPPYSGHSSNVGDWITKLIKDYKKVDGAPLGERNPKWLQDDYVKFIRFAQWKIDQAGRGVVGMITNHSYLDNPTFRGMRQSLLKTFDDIYLLDLHGNSLKQETCPDGSADKNVFDIRQGVAIVLLIKRGGKPKTDALVHYADLWGAREAKYTWLRSHERTNTPWQILQPISPSYLFIQQDNTLRLPYEAYPSVKTIFPVNSVGVLTAQDDFAISWSADEARNKVNILLRTRSEQEARLTWQLCTQGQWDYERAKKELAHGEWRNEVTQIHYRPFDIRWTVFNPNVIISRRWTVMRHMLAGKNLALMVMRQVSWNDPYSHVFVTKLIADNRAFVSSKGIISAMPLYLYPTTKDQTTLTRYEPAERIPNLSPTILAALPNIGPETIFHYIYAILYTPTYRHKYAQFLRMDFPRIPFTTDRVLFDKLATLGERLTALHLLQSRELSPPTCKFEGSGNSTLGRGRKGGLFYDPTAQCVHINATQYFGPLPESVWRYQIGGYQVCEKWLKDRQERSLDLDDIRTYCRLVTAIGYTLEIQRELDALYAVVEVSTMLAAGKS